MRDVLRSPAVAPHLARRPARLSRRLHPHLARLLRPPGAGPRSPAQDRLPGDPLRLRRAGPRERPREHRARPAVHRHDEPRQFLRPVRLSGRLPAALRGAEEESHFRWPVYGGTIRRLGMFPIDRKNTRQAVESLRRAAAWIRRAGRLLVRHPARGDAHARREARPVQARRLPHGRRDGLGHPPCRPERRVRDQPQGELSIRPGRVDVTIEPAVPTAGYSKDNIDELIERVRRVFLDRLGESTS